MNVVYTTGTKCCGGSTGLLANHKSEIVDLVLVRGSPGTR